MDSVWIWVQYGFHMDPIWIQYGFTIDAIWIQDVDPTWNAYGFNMESISILYGVRRGLLPPLLNINTYQNRSTQIW